MDLIESSTLSYDYASDCTTVTDDSDGGEIGEHLREVTYKQHGQYDPDAADVEDSKLLNWDKWVRCRKTQEQRLTTLVNRQKTSLVMNSNDVYKKNRNHQLIDYAYNYITFDKYRGDPKFWKTPNYIYDGCEKDIPVNCPVQEYFDRNVIDKNSPPELEYIGIPNWGLQGKKLYADTSTNRHKCDYFTDRKAQLKENVKLIDTFTPDLDNLYVIGEKFLEKSTSKSETIENFFLDTVIILECLRDPVERNTIDDRFPILKIQGNIVDKNTMKNLEGDFRQVINFLDCSMNKSYSRKLIVENVGNVCVRYSWEQVEPYRNPNFPLRYRTQLVQRFYFPTGRNVFITGQITEISCVFKSKEPGVFRETWKLIVDPKFAKNKFIVFELQGFVRSEIESKRMFEIESYIEKCRLTSVVENMLDEIFVDSQLETCLPYESRFTDKDIFLHNNRNHFYEFEKVQALFELNEKIMGDIKWDFSINTLLNNILTKVELLDDRRAFLVQLHEISNSLLKQNVEVDINKEKYRNVYQILGSFANMLEQEAQNLQAVFKIREFSDFRQNRLDSQDRLPSIAEGSTSSLKLKKQRNSSVPSVKSRKSKQRSSIGSKLDNISSNSGSQISFADNVVVDPTLDKRTSQYIETLCIKTYQYLSTAVDEITAIIESLNMYIIRK